MKRLTEAERAERDRKFATAKTCCVCDKQLKPHERPYTPGDPGPCDQCARANPYRLSGT